jgi:chromosome segregation ATPase
MIGLMRRVEQRFEGFRTAIEEIRKQQSNLLAQLDSMREQRDHWQRMAERLWTNQSGQR